MRDGDRPGGPEPPGEARPSAPGPVLLLTCEHAGNRVPDRWAHLFVGAEATLASHRGWDPGALDLARGLAERLAPHLGAPLLAHDVTRLLADPNRSAGHPRVLGPAVRSRPPADRDLALATFHRPHREAVEREVARLLGRSGSTPPTATDDRHHPEPGRTGPSSSIGSRKPVVHVGVHTFTPVLDGTPRETAVGILYDPERSHEREMAAAWAAALRERLPGLRIHRNRPYRGTSDGLTTTLRSRFDPADYVGLELEVRSDLATGSAGERERLAGTLADTLREALLARAVPPPYPA